ncbi:MAG: glutaminase domain-containing protein, partial [Nakamurella sp.]
MTTQPPSNEIPDSIAHSLRRFLAMTGAAGLAATATGGLLPSIASAAALPGLRPATASPTTASPTPAAAKGGKTPTPTFTPVRPPAVPLAVRSPYLSAWLAADSLPGTWPTFWTGRINAMAGIARIDENSYVFMGSPALADKNPFPTMRQTSLTVTATKSTFVLQQGGIELTVQFFSPVEPGDLRRQGMPLSYISATARSIDGDAHQVSLYFDISGEWSYGDTNAEISWDETTIGTGPARVISLSQTPATPKVLAEESDTASWGTTVWSTVKRAGLTYQIGEDQLVRTQATSDGVLTDNVDSNKPRAISDHWPVFALNLDLGTIRTAGAPFVISIGHVREPAVSYLGTPLPPLWKSHFASWQEMVAFFHKDFTAAAARGDTLDTMIDRDARAKGGVQYAGILALSLRQAFGGSELVSRNGKPWAFLKEISSDGNISTIDVTYPCMPAFLYADPAYLALILEPMLDYAENGGWPKEFAEHDLGSHYPVADGHNDGNEEDMPVEESANILIMCTAYLQRADVKSAKAFATAHYPILKKWSDYLVANALDPDLQNQTDDFTGFIAHSVNLALKGILGIGAMSLVSTLLGKKVDAAYYLGVAKSYIGQWVTKATDVSGEHLKLAYDQDGTWSLKYNGYPDKLLGLNLIPAKVAKLEAE